MRARFVQLKCFPCNVFHLGTEEFMPPQTFPISLLLSHCREFILTSNALSDDAERFHRIASTLRIISTQLLPFRALLPCRELSASNFRIQHQLSGSIHLCASRHHFWPNSLFYARLTENKLQGNKFAINLQLRYLPKSCPKATPAPRHPPTTAKAAIPASPSKTTNY